MRRRAACALILTWAMVPSAVAAQQASGGGTTAKKSAAKTTAHKHHKASSSTTTSSKSASATGTSGGKHSARKKKPSRTRGQQKIDSERARTIQAALIREHYLTGAPAGTWNQASEDAMRRYQNDHGWQTKEVPDSRALISLGLGPSKDHLLNPESAMTSTPATLTPAAHDKPAPKPAPSAGGDSRPQ